MTFLLINEMIKTVNRKKYVFGQKVMNKTKPRNVRALS